MRQLNLNTVLITIVLAIGAWNLKETVSHGNIISKFQEQIYINQRDIQEFRLRMAKTESELVLLQIQLAKMRVQ